jgi:hypothetical protein
MNRSVLDWLLAGDVSIRYQTHRDLFDEHRPDLQARIATEGWGARFLAARNPDGSWGRGFYQPKWISSHYTLLDLKTLNVAPDEARIRQSVDKIVQEEIASDGGVNPAKTIAQSDVCVNGMFLNYACYFGQPEATLRSIVDFILEQRMTDGGFNCRKNRSGARHSSLHSTLSVLEGIQEYAAHGYAYRLAELQQAAEDGREFILQHQLFKSDRTGEIIHKRFLSLAFPPRWKYNVLRALDYFQAAGVPWDERMRAAMDLLHVKQRKDGRWPQQAAHPGQVHFVMEPAGGPGRWNTLLALRVRRAYG